MKQDRLWQIRTNNKENQTRQLQPETKWTDVYEVYWNGHQIHEHQGT
jgi:hypothetical protein